MNLWLVIAPALLALPAIGGWLLLADPHGRVRLGLREAALWTVAGWAAFVSLGAELLSLGAGHDLNAPASGHLTRGWLVAVWLIPAIAGLHVIVTRRAVLAPLWDRVITGARALTGLDRFLAIAIGVCLALVALVALACAPTTWDSMVYHLARVAAWLQLGGVAHYATQAEPQLFQPPGAEMILAQLQAITGGDHLAACVQLVSYGLVIAAASLIAKRLGGDRRGQLLAAFLVATLPTAIVQGSSTQNDLVVALWLLTAGCLALTIFNDDRLPIARTLVAALAVGLAILTKGTAWIYLPPILLLLAWAIVRRVGWPRLLVLAAAGLAIVVVLNGGQWERNHQTYGKFVFSGSGFYDYSNDSHSPGAVVSNLVRNAGIYLGTPSESVNARPSGWLRDGLTRLGINPDDGATTFPGQLFSIGLSGPDESHAPSLLMFLLMIWAIISALALRRFRTRLRLVWALAIIAQILLFALLIKWQTFHSRLHLPVVIAAAPLVAVALREIPSAERIRRWTTGAVISIATLVAPVYLLLNVDRPLIGYDGHRSILTSSRDAEYFNARPGLRAPYTSAIKKLNASGTHSLVLYGGFDDWYYPFNALMDDGARTSYAFVPNPSAKYPQPSGRQIKAVACINCDAAKQAQLKAIGLEQVPNLYSQPLGMKGALPGAFELWIRPR
ncbi:MAG: glycosyltransferase family 39 protein [Solirubrobacterales bacterium]